MIASSIDPVSVIVQRSRARRCGNGFVAKCPAQQDRNPSLSITEGDDGRVLLRCHAGCPVEDIVAALGLEMRDLFRADKSIALPFKPPRREVAPAIPAVPQMPESVSKDWWEGVDYVQGQPKLIDRIADYRDWPSPFAQYMVESLGISMPRYGDVRGIAFLVVAPEGVPATCRHDQSVITSGCQKVATFRGSTVLTRNRTGNRCESAHRV